MAKTQPATIQFTLTALLALFVAVWSAMALFGGEIGLIVVLFYVGGLLLAPQIKTCVEWIVIFMILLILIALMLPAIERPRSYTRALHCRSNLSNLAKAIQAYRADYGQFPPACVRDANDQPMHSWRVLLLPYLGHDNLYASYRFDEPWDGPNNSTLRQSIPLEYRCPALTRRQRSLGLTTYVAIVGKQTAWPDDRPMRESDIHDGADQTILIGEVPSDLNICWLEPRDIPFDKAALGIHQMDWSTPANNAVEQLAASHPWPENSSSEIRVTHVAMADGTVHVLPEDMKPDDLRALLTAAGNEPINVKILSTRSTSTIIGRIISAILLIVSLTVLTVSVVRHRRKLNAWRESHIKTAEAGSEEGEG